ncbi:MAG TPA: hypothetical protein VIY28_15025 [Pseudonocardiaceae bacterium]
MGRSARWMPVVVTAAVAALLAGAAVVTAEGAGCDQPGRYVRVAGGVQLVGGCLNSDDLPVAPPPVEQPPPPPVKPLGL